MPADSLAGLMAHARQLPNLTAAQERELCHQMRAGSSVARDKLIEHNIRLAAHLAREWSGCGLPMEDLVQEALVGLNKAVDRFDPDKGRLTTFATRWIYKSLWEAGYGSNPIKRPSRLSRTVSATWDYLASHPHSSIEDIAAAIKRPIEEVSEALDHGRVVASINEDGFREVAEESLDDVVQVLDQLDPAEREAVSWRYGLYGRERSLEEVAEKMSEDTSLPGEYTQRDAARLCRAAVKRLRAARVQEDDEVLCVVE